MLKVFLKDVRAGAIFLWAVVPLNILAALQVSRSGAGFFWANVTCAAFILVAVSMLEWKNEADPFVHSLPVTRAAVVRGRYLTAVAIGVLSLLTAAAVGTARGVGLLMRGMPWPRWVAGDMALAFLLAFAVVAAIYLPCYFRWGFGRGNVAAALVVAGGILISSAVGSSAAGMPERSAGGTAYGIVPAGLIPQGVARLIEQAGPAAGAFLVLGAVAGTLWVSSKVAERAYEGREF
jgi:hypothetical protein